MMFEKSLWIALLASMATPALAADAAETSAASETIIVTGLREVASAGSKTDTPVVKLPQALTVVPAETYLAQGAISISDTLNYVAGVTANPYGPDSRVDGGFVRGLRPLQFRDGMRDLFSFYASIRSDPYNFSRVELVRGPASTLFGSGALGGLLNMVSKTPTFTDGGEVLLRYGSFDRKEILADVQGTAGDVLAGRLVARVRDAGTQVNFVPDDRVMIAPSLRWRPSDRTDVQLIGLYQEDDMGSTSQFLPLVGTLLPNPNGKLKNSTFIGKPGWDRYDGRLLQGTALIDHRFNDNVHLSVKARYIDSDLTYLTHYPDSYSNPANPYQDAAQRMIGLYADGSYARLNIFSTDNNLVFDFHTGENIKHVLLAGIDYSWNRVRKEGGFAYETIDIYNINYAALSDFGGGFPTAANSGNALYLGSFPEDTAQKQLGFYVQDQIELWKKVTVLLGARRDHVRSKTPGGPTEKDKATTFRAGMIAEMLPGISPFLGYTESFDPLSGIASDGSPFKPKAGHQYEGGVKFHPSDRVLVTATAYKITEKGTPIDDPATPDPFDQIQAGRTSSKGYEFEANWIAPGDFELIAAYSRNKAQARLVTGPSGQLENVPKENASIWATKTLELAEDTRLKLGGGVRYTAPNRSATIKTPSYTLVDAIIDLRWKDWGLTLNANNLLNKKFYAACLSRGDCFIGAERNIMATITRRF